MTNGDTRTTEGATPLDPDEVYALIPGLLTKDELNAFEQANIAQAISWAKTSRILKKNLLTIDSLKLLHRRMFNNTWKWAGTFRTSGKSIGAKPHLIPSQLAYLCGDGTYWLAKRTFSVDICAIRFHHRLVSIHPFPNGNGRHSRLIADLMMIYTGNSPFSWGGRSIDPEGETRADYLRALRAADKGDYDSLIDFAHRK